MTGTESDWTILTSDDDFAQNSLYIETERPLVSYAGGIDLVKSETYEIALQWAVMP